MASILYIFIAVLLIAYVYSYYLHPSVPEIIQIPAAKFSDTILLDKQPVVVEDGGTDFIARLLKGFMITAPVNQPDSPPEWRKNKYKYLAIQVGDSKEDILVCPATAKRDNTGAPVTESAIIAFRMSLGQTLIVPFHWLYYIDSPSTTNMSGIHDLVTYFLP
jgi:hypothetical protein